MAGHANGSDGRILAAAGHARRVDHVFGDVGTLLFVRDASLRLLPLGAAAGI